MDFEYQERFGAVEFKYRYRWTCPKCGEKTKWFEQKYKAEVYDWIGQKPQNLNNAGEYSGIDTKKNWIFDELMDAAEKNAEQNLEKIHQAAENNKAFSILDEVNLGNTSDAAYTSGGLGARSAALATMKTQKSKCDHCGSDSFDTSKASERRGERRLSLIAFFFEFLLFGLPCILVSVLMKEWTVVSYIVVFALGGVFAALSLRTLLKYITKRRAINSSAEYKSIENKELLNPDGSAHYEYDFEKTVIVKKEKHPKTDILGKIE